MPLPIGRRDIQALAVKCANVERGCEWRGTVGTQEEHLATCKFALVPCPNKCEGNSIFCFMRKNLDQHLEEACPNRPDACKHCGENGTYAVIQAHDEVCPKKEIPCPNCDELKPRKVMEDHIDNECLLTEVPCKFARIGCERILMRKDMAVHGQDTELHLQIALDTVVELKDDQKKLKDAKAEIEDTQKRLGDTLVELQDTNAKLMERERTLTFALLGYAEKKAANQRFTSPSSYTISNGYHMAVLVDVNGTGSGAGSHVSAFLTILQGNYDAGLKWPFTGRVTFTLLNQLEDKNHYTRTLSITAENNLCAGSLGWGYPSFVPHSALPYDCLKNTQYLKDDTLYFRVSVEVDDHAKRPWLECTAK